MKNTRYTLVGIIMAILAYFAGNGAINPGPTPSPSPTPSASAEPTVLPTALPTPSPAATPTPTPSPAPACALPPSQGPACEDNPTDAAQYRDAVTAAQDTAAKNGFVTESGKVVGERRYTDEVVRILISRGYCATNGLPDEVWVKRDTNAFSEHYDIVTSSNDVWQHFAAKCRPAHF